MYRQKVTNRQPDALRGLAVVAGVALAVYVGNLLFTRLAARIGTLASVGFILYGIAIAWLLLYWFVLGFSYTAAGDCLRVCRFYGRRERFVADVRLGQVQAYGTPDEVRARFPSARVTRATRSECAFEPFALAYPQGGRTAVIVIQPDDTLRARLLEGLHAKK